ESKTGRRGTKVVNAPLAQRIDQKMGNSLRRSCASFSSAVINSFSTPFSDPRQWNRESPPSSQSVAKAGHRATSVSRSSANSRTLARAEGGLRGYSKCQAMASRCSPGRVDKSCRSARNSVAFSLTPTTSPSPSVLQVMRMRSTVKRRKKTHSMLSVAISRLSTATSSGVILLGRRIPCNCVVKSETVKGRMVRWVRVDRGRN
ncbi:hypothetical protein B0H14DRAFT_2982764, partial [Mycena olivaceomarginata]